MAGEGAVLDPLLGDPLADVQRRLTALELRPKVQPPVPIVMGSYNANPDTQWRGQFTNAAYGANGWSGVTPRIARQGVWLQAAWSTPAATTGEVQLTAASGTLTASAITLPAASSGTISYLWLHGGELWNTAFNIDLGVRRTGGAGTVLVTLPQCFWVDATGCTTTGL